MSADEVTRPSAVVEDERKVDLLYPELGPIRSVWRERTLLFRSYMEMRERLRNEYPDSWIALVRDDRVIVAPDLPTIHERLKEEGYEPLGSVIKYMYTGAVIGDDLKGAAEAYKRGFRRV